MRFHTKFVSLALVSAVALSGCSFSREVTSLLPYSPSDGNQTDIELVKARNFMLISADGVSGVIIGSLVNDGPNDAIAEVQFVQPNGERVVRSLAIGSGSKADIGYNGSDPMQVELDATPGSLVTVFFNVDGVAGSLQIPVLDGSLAEYRSFVEG